MLAGLWAGIWRGVEKTEMRKQIREYAKMYTDNHDFAAKVDQVVISQKSFKDLVESLKRDASIFEVVTGNTGQTSGQV
jgi:hypothetical protein